MQNLNTVCYNNNIPNFDDFPKYANIYNQALEDFESKIKECCSISGSCNYEDIERIKDQIKYY